MRFSIWPMPNLGFEEVLYLFEYAERTGWDGAWTSDHFMAAAEDTSGPWPEGWTTLAALAARVPRIRVGMLVTGNTYRNPAILAKMAATVDHISGGRLVFGLGGGWQENEHRQYGIEFDTVIGRLRRLDEACQVIKSLFTQEKSDFSGDYYTLEDASLFPKPIQSPLPLLIGGGGEKVTLKIAAKYADEWNVWGTPEDLRHKGAILDQHCADVGRDPSEIQRSAVAQLYISEDEQMLDKVRQTRYHFPTNIGTPEEIRAIVAEYAAAGVDELVVPDFMMGGKEQKTAMMDLFMEKVANR